MAYQKFWESSQGHQAKCIPNIASISVPRDEIKKLGMNFANIRNTISASQKFWESSQGHQARHDKFVRKSSESRSVKMRGKFELPNAVGVGSNTVTIPPTVTEFVTEDTQEIGTGNEQYIDEMVAEYARRTLIHRFLECVVVCCSVLQCVAVCCSVLQCEYARRTLIHRFHSYMH